MIMASEDIIKIHIENDIRLIYNGFVKSSISAFSFILRHCGVPKSTPHGQDCRQKLRCARLDLEQAEHRYFAISNLTFYEFVKGQCCYQQLAPGPHERLR